MAIVEAPIRRSVDQRTTSDIYLIWMAGFGMGHPMDEKLVATLSQEELFNEGNVAFESSIGSWEKPENDKHQRIASQVVDMLLQGKRVVFAMHSFGGVEGSRVTHHMLKMHPNLVESGLLKRFHPVFISTVGTHEGISTREKARRVKRLTEPFRPSVRSGLDSIAVGSHTLFEDGEFAPMLRGVFDHRLTGHDQEAVTVSLEHPVSEVDFTEKDRRKLVKIDGEMACAIGVGDTRGVIVNLFKRSQVGRSAILAEYYGSDNMELHAKYMDALHRVPGLMRAYAVSGLGILSLVGDMHRDSALHTFENLAPYCGQAFVIGLEYDVIKKKSDNRNLAKKTDAIFINNPLDNHQSMIARPHRIAAAFAIIKKTIEDLENLEKAYYFPNFI